jgi:alpha-galactosidase
MIVERTAGETTVTYESGTARLTVADGDGRLLEGDVRVAVSDEYAPGDARTRGDDNLTTIAPGTATEDGDAISVTHDDAFETTVTLAPADGAVDVTVSVTNGRDVPVELGDLAPIAGGTSAFGPEDRVFEHGYQSWTATGTLDLGERYPTEPPYNRPQMLDLAAPLEARASHYVTALTGDPGGVTLGFLDHEAYLSRFELATDDRTRLAAVCPGDGVALDPGETRTTAPLRIDATRPVADGLRAIADAVADCMDARVPDSAPTGWCTWYHYYTGVTADDVRENLAAIEEWDVPVEVVQIDDGYETAFGDWRTLADGFDDMRALREDVADAGHRPGLWLAPFYAQADSDLVDAHPDWFVTDENGVPVDAGERHGSMYALDTTHPDALAWLEDTFETVVEDWGFSYLKLDFLYCAAMPGQRYADVTRGEAYRRGLETIRDAVGDDVFVLGCGAPTFPSVGAVDAMRVGPDTASFWRDPDDPLSQPAHENAVRNVLNRQFCHRRLWVTDPDCQLVRETTDLTDAERRAFAAVVALSGGSNVFSDAISEIDDTGRTLLERTLPPVENGSVEGLARREIPDRLRVERPADGTGAVAAFNWGDDSATVTVDPREYVESSDEGDDSVDRVRCWDAFAGELLEPDGPVQRDVGGHGVAVLQCAPARSHPHLVGARHLANAASQVTAVDWTTDGARGTLTVTVEAPRPMDLIVAVPDGWQTGTESTADGDGDPSTLEPVRVTAEPGTTTVEFQRGPE